MIGDKASATARHCSTDTAATSAASADSARLERWAPIGHPEIFIGRPAIRPGLDSDTEYTLLVRAFPGLPGLFALRRYGLSPGSMCRRTAAAPIPATLFI